MALKGTTLPNSDNAASGEILWKHKVFVGTTISDHSLSASVGFVLLGAQWLSYLNANWLGLYCLLIFLCPQWRSEISDQNKIENFLCYSSMILINMDF